VRLWRVHRGPSPPSDPRSQPIGKVGAEHLDIEILDRADSKYLDVEILDLKEAA